MASIWKTDVAISFAEEDHRIASALAGELKKQRVSCYFYKEHNNLGKHLEQITRQEYGELTHTGLIIISDNYTQKRWAVEEFDTLLEADRREVIKRLFVVVVKNAPVPQRLGNIVYAEWNNNAAQIAGQIAEGVRESLGDPGLGRKWQPFLLWCFFLVLIAAIVLGFYG